MSTDCISYKKVVRGAEALEIDCIVYCHAISLDFDVHLQAPMEIQIIQDGKESIDPYKNGKFCRTHSPR